MNISSNNMKWFSGYSLMNREKGTSGRVIAKGNKEADRADAKEMIEGEFQRLRTEGGKGLSGKKPQGTDGDAPETAGAKMKRLVQEWKDLVYPYLAHTFKK